jgi:murein DD-endopeptidase MepM/ murein hydrolase activator NlpD
MRPRSSPIPRSGRIAALALVVILAVPASPAAGAPEDARAKTAVTAAVEARASLRARLQQLRGLPSRHRAAMQGRPTLAEAMLARQGVSLERRDVTTLATRSRRADARTARDLQRLDRRVGARVESLRERIAALTWWLQTTGIFRVCPVPEYTTIYDDYGEMVRVPRVRPHIHRGSDVTAPTWSPILAPFDGYASASRSYAGGLEVRVRGERGYVYNAHLIGYARLGWVRTGDVVGYVGSTGDSTAPHDHIEWHPWGGAAVDPHALIVAACVPL